MQADWELSQTLTSDGQGIRCAAVLPPLSNDEKNDHQRHVCLHRIITGTQSGNLVEYSVPSGELKIVDFQHDHAVTAILATTSSSSSKTSYYFTGCKDSQIRMFDADNNHTLLATLKGHEKPVTSLAWADNAEQKYLISGSWDGTAKIWDVERHVLVATLDKHENSVCVAGISSSPSDNSNILTVVTGSAGMAVNNNISGHTTRLWQINVTTGDTKLLHSVANDHDGPIRDIACIANNKNKEDAVLATSSNDGSVKLRNVQNGTVESTLVFVQLQHPPMLLSVTIHPSGSYVAAGAEDGHVVVWDLHHSGRGGEPQILRHAQCVWNVYTFSNGDLLTCCQDGCLRIFTRDSERMATVEERNKFHDEVQEVLNKTKSGPSSEEISKLPLWERNFEQRGRSEGQVQLFQKDGVAIAAQWSAASQTWIEVGEVTGRPDEQQASVDGVKYDHVFPIEVDQTGGSVANLQIGYNDGENPFAAAQRFIDAHMLPQHHLAEIADYITQRLGNNKPTVLGMQPPSQSAVTGTPIASYQYLPSKSYKAFELLDKAAQSTMQKMKNKIQEFGASDAVLTQVGTLMETLVASNRYHSSKVQDSELSSVTEMLNTFSPSQAFPALDLARLTVLHPDAASSNRANYWNGLIQQTISLSLTSQPLEGPAAVAIPMLSLRVFANAFKGGPGSRQAVIAHVDKVLDCIEKHVKSSNKNVRLSAATVVYNLSSYVHQEKNALLVVPKLVPILNEIISAKTYETEALFRSMVALGTLVMASAEAKDAANALFLASKVEPAASPHTDQVKGVAKEIYSLLA